MEICIFYCVWTGIFIAVSLSKHDATMIKQCCCAMRARDKDKPPTLIQVPLTTTADRFAVIRGRGEQGETGTGGRLCARHDKVITGS